MSIIEVLKIDQKELAKPCPQGEVRLVLKFFLDKPIIFRLLTNASIDGTDIMHLVSKSISKRLNISKKDYDKYGEIGISLISTLKERDKTKEITLENNTIITSGSEVYLEILPTGDAISNEWEDLKRGLAPQRFLDVGKGAYNFLSTGYSGAGIKAGVALGSFGGPVTAAVFGFIGGIVGAGVDLISPTGYGHENEQSYIRGRIANADALWKEVEHIKEKQPIQVREPEKIESKELKKFLVTNRIEPDAIIPEIYGKIRVKPGAMTPFYAYDIDALTRSITYNYEGNYHFGEGPLDISSYQLGEELTPDDFNDDTEDRSVDLSLGFFERQRFTLTQGGGSAAVIHLPTRKITGVSRTIPSVDSTGLFLSWSKTGFTNSSVNVDFRVRIRPSLAGKDFSFIGETNNANYNWLNLYFNNTSTSYASLAQVPASSKSNPLKLIARNSSGRYYALDPKSNSQVPLFLIEVQLNTTSGFSDKLSSGLSIVNRKSNSLYTLAMPSFEELTSSTSFNDFVFRLKTDIYTGKTIQSIRVFRVSYADVSNGSINLNSLNTLSGSVESSVQILKLTEFFFSRSVVNYNVKQDEVVLQYRVDARTPTTPRFPSIENAPIFDTDERESVTYTFTVEYADGVDEDFDILEPNPRYFNDLEDYNDDVTIYNNRVADLLEDYEDEVEDYRIDLQEFNDRFNRFAQGIGRFTALAERRVRNVLGNQPSTYIKSRNPADIVLDMGYKFLHSRSDINILLEDLFDIEEFTKWKAFCTRNSLTFDGVFDFETTFFDAIKQVAFVGFADLDFTTGKIRPIIKTKRSTIIQHFHSRNISNLTVSKTNIIPPHKLTVQYLRERRGKYEADERSSYTGGHTSSTFRTEEKTSLFGVTDRADKYLTHQIRIYENPFTIYTFQTSFDGVVARRGDLVALNHYEIEPTALSARVRKLYFVDGSTTRLQGVQIDQSEVPDLENNVDYVASIISSGNITKEIEIDRIEDKGIYDSEETLFDSDDSELFTRPSQGSDTILSRPEKRKTLIFKNPINLNEFTNTNGDTLEVGDPIIFGKKNSYLQKCLVQSITLDKSLNVSVVLVSYNESIYNLS